MVERVWPVTRQRNVVVAILLVLAAVGWVVIMREANDAGSMTMATARGTSPDLTMGRDWPLFMAMWVAMMAAMMLPAAAPMVVMFGRMRRGDSLSIVLFGGAYIALGSALGVVAYLVSLGVESATAHSAWAATNWGRGGGGVLIAAGIYQLTPAKDICLRRCRTPLSFVMTRWRDGRGGAVRMGLRHGVYCLGCCWLLFLLLIPLGVMNVAAMVAVAAVVYAEKVAPRGRAIGRVAAIGIAGYGVAVCVHPALLPTVA